MLGARLLGNRMVRTAFRGVYSAAVRRFESSPARLAAEREYSCPVPTIQPRSMVR